MIMGRMRSILRAYALGSRDPAEALDRWTGNAALGPDALATVLYAIIDTSLMRMRLLSGGHLRRRRRSRGGLPAG